MQSISARAEPYRKIRTNLIKIQQSTLVSFGGHKG